MHKTLRTIFFCITLSLFASVTVISQTESKVELVDEIGEAITGELLLYVLDNFALQLQERKAKGLIIYYRSDNKINNHFILSFLKNHRFIRPVGDMYAVVTVSRPQAPSIQAWIDDGTKAAEISGTEISFDLSDQLAKGPVSFYGDLYGFERENGKETFMEIGCPSVCIGYLSYGLLNSFVENNPNSLAYLVLRGTKSRSNRVIAKLKNDIKEAGMDLKKIRFVYAGSKMNYSDKNYVEVDAFIANKEKLTAKDFPYKHEK